MVDAGKVLAPLDSVDVAGAARHLAEAVAMRRRTRGARNAFEERRRGAFWGGNDEGMDGGVRTAMVFCAGLGTRLRPLTLEYPKPAVPFFGAPLIRYSMALLKSAGIQRLVINTHHLPDVMERTAIREAERAGFESLSVSSEPVLMDTAGGLRDARRFMDGERILVVNGDSFLSMDFRDVVRRHVRSGALATLCVAPPVPGENFRAIEADGAGRIAKIRGKGPDVPGLSPWHFLGVHVIEPELFGFIPTDGPRDINGETYPKAIAEGRFIQALPVEVGCWADLGTPRRYYDACMEILSGGVDLSAMGDSSPLRNGAMRGQGSFVVEGGSVPGSASLEASVVCEGVKVGEGARIVRSILLPGAVVPPRQEVRDAILWPGGCMPVH